MSTDNLSEYAWKIRLSTFDAGFGRDIKLSSVLKLQQEIGELHLRELNMTYNQLYDEGLIFVVTKASAIIHKMPVLGQDLTLTTWNHGVKGIQFFRCYDWADKDGNKLIEACSSFVLVDAKTHALLRPSALGAHNLPKALNRYTSCPEPTKIHLPQNMCNTKLREIRFSDIDYNGHLNNTVYADFILDFMPGSMKNKRIKSFCINFLKEAVEGDELDITTHDENGTVYFNGTHQRGDCFSAKCEYDKI